MGRTGLRPFFSFYGGKWRDAIKHYPKPIYDTIVEPFAGSAGYALRYPDRHIVLSDADPVIAGVWEYLITVKPSEILSIPDIGHDETVDDLPIPQEAKWLVGFWLNKGAERPRKTPSKWMRSGVRPGSFWGKRVRETIASQVDSIRHWVVGNNNYDGISPACNATWFIDPPYQLAGKHYSFGSRHIDYDELADWCRTRSGQVIVCEQEGATWLPFCYARDSKTSRHGKVSREVLYQQLNPSGHFGSMDDLNLSRYLGNSKKNSR